MFLDECLKVDLIEFIYAKKRDEALLSLVQNAYEKKILSEDPMHFYKALLQREKIISTGIGMGIAIPHAKLKEIKNFFLVIGVQKEKPLDWNSFDQIGVKLIFMIGGPEHKQNEYLQILSQLTSCLKEEKIRKKLLKASSIQEVIDSLQN